MRLRILTWAALAFVAVGPALDDDCQTASGRVYMSASGQMPGCREMSAYGQMPGCGQTTGRGQTPDCGGRPAWTDAKWNMTSALEPGCGQRVMILGMDMKCGPGRSPRMKASGPR